MNDLPQTTLERLKRAERALILMIDTLERLTQNTWPAGQFSPELREIRWALLDQEASKGAPTK